MKWIGLTVLLVYAALTLHQASRYHDPVLLWSDAMRFTPTFRAAINYRQALMADGQWELAIGQCASLTHLAVTLRERRIVRAVCFSSRSSH